MDQNSTVNNKIRRMAVGSEEAAQLHIFSFFFFFFLDLELILEGQEIMINLGFGDTGRASPQSWAVMEI